LCRSINIDKCDRFKGVVDVADLADNTALVNGNKDRDYIYGRVKGYHTAVFCPNGGMSL